MNSPHMVSTIVMVYSKKWVVWNLLQDFIKYWKKSSLLVALNTIALPEPLIRTHHYQQHKLHCIQLGPKKQFKKRLTFFSCLEVKRTGNLNSFCHCIFGQIYYTHEIHIYKLVKILSNYKNSTCIQCVFHQKNT